MYIAFVLPSMNLESGGPPKVVVNLCSGLLRLDYSIHIYTLDANLIALKHDYPFLFSTDAIKFFCFKPKYLFSKIGYSHSLVQTFVRNAHLYNCVHIHCLWELSLAKVASVCIDKSIPYVISPHGMLDLFELRKSRFAKKLFLTFLGTGNMLKHASSVIYGTPEDRLRSEKTGFSHSPVIIPNPISDSDKDFNASTYLSGLMYDRLLNHVPYDFHSDKVITFFGRLNKKKGIVELFEAYLLASESHPNLKLLILALEDDKDLEEYLKRRVKSEGLKDNVFITTNLFGPQAKYLLSCSALFALPSYQEGFSTAIVEAMSLRVPILLSDQCNMSFLADLNAAIITKPTVESIYEGILHFMSLSYNEQRTMAAKSYDWIIENATSSAVAQKLDSLYSSLL